jgi:hypothetical protein
MKRLKFQIAVDPAIKAYKDDITKITTAFREHGYIISDEDAYRAWQRFSDEHFAATWLMLGDSTSKRIFSNLKEYFVDE